VLLAPSALASQHAHRTQTVLRRPVLIVSGQVRAGSRSPYELVGPRRACIGHVSMHVFASIALPLGAFCSPESGECNEVIGGSIRLCSPMGRGKNMICRHFGIEKPCKQETYNIHCPPVMCNRYPLFRRVEWYDGCTHRMSGTKDITKITLWGVKLEVS